MDLFSIQCTTCQAKLKVRDASAIGKILSCPRCESMVQIVAPPGWTPPVAAPPATSQPSATASVRQPGAAVPQGRQPAAAPATAALPTFDIPDLDVPRSHVTPPPIAGEAVAGASVPDAAAAPTMPGSTEPAHFGPAHWTTPTEQLSRKVALWSGAGITALVAIAALTHYLWSGEDAAPVVAESAVVSSAEPAAEPEPETLPATSETPAEKAPPADHLPAPAKTPAVAEKPPATASAEPAPKTKPASNAADRKPTPKSEATVATTEKSAEPLEQSPKEADDDLPRADPPTGEGALPRLPLKDPFGDALLDATPPPQGTTIVADKKDEAETGERSKPADELATSEGFPDDLVGEGPKSDAHPAEEAGEDAEEPTSRVGVVRRETSPASMARRPPIDQLLTLSLRKVEFHDVPLSRLVGELSDLTLLPINFDLPALAAAGISPDAPVTVAQERVSVANLLTEALTQRKLTLRTSAGHVQITTPAAADTKVRLVPLSIGDLAATPEAMKEFAALVPRLIACSTWEPAGGEGLIKVEGDRLVLQQTGPVVQEVALFCEKLRLARGLRPRGSLPADVLRIDPRVRQAAKVLAAEVACTFHRPTRLVEVLRYLEAGSGARIFVDWESAVHADWAPHSEISCALDKQPLGEALTKLLEPLALAWRIVDARTVEVFALQDAPAKMQIEFYPIGPLLAAGVQRETLTGAIGQLGGPESWQAETGGVLHFDEPSRHLVVRQTPAVHSHIQRLLAELAKKTAAK